MKWQTARCGDEIFVLEKDRILTMVPDPQISEIPETNGDVRGISFYQNKAVIFYQVQRTDAGRIGILMTHEPGILSGIVVEEILDEVEELDEGAREIVPGMWVIEGD